MVANQSRPGFVWSSAANDWVPIAGVLDVNRSYDFNAASTIGGNTIINNTMPISGFRNAIINGGMDVWQRGTSFTHTSGSFYTADRFSFFADGTGGTKTISQQSFTPGAGSISGYEPTFFWRFNQSAVPTSQTEIELTQPIEDVRTFAGQTVTISFWAKADASRTVTTKFRQIFGTGGSAFVDSATQNNSLTTSWQRFTHTVTVPSINGKTVSASNNSRLELKFVFPSGVTQTIDIWGVQVEPGTIATPFEHRPIGTELALCQRYYQKITPSNTVSLAFGHVQSTVTERFTVPIPVSLRTLPALTATGTFTSVGNGGGFTLSSLSVLELEPNCVIISGTSATAHTIGALIMYGINGNVLAFDSEL